jgi:hypothetical protein
VDSNASENEELDYIIINYCSNKISKTELLDYVSLSEELQNHLLDTIESRKVKICKHLLNINNSKIIPLLINFDWDIKFIIGNSSITSFRDQKASILFDCLFNNANKSIPVEADLNMIEAMIHEIEHNSHA